MSQIFVTVLNMSITASVVALVVILARLALRKSPKIFSYALWVAVLFRMLSPVAIESGIGFSRPLPQAVSSFNMSTKSETIYGYAFGYATGFYPEISYDTGIGERVMQSFASVAPIIWLLGIAILLVYAAVSYIKIKRRVFSAVLVRGNIYESDCVSSPFVIGFIRPRIIIPAGLNAHEADYIIRHEKTHIRRGDHFIKLLAFAGLVLHWFNPIIWASYFLMVRDMELSCDESVMRQSTADIRADYSHSLLNMYARQSGLLPMLPALPNPLSFCESSVKSRVRNVLNFKKRSWFTVTISAVFTVAVVGVCVVNAASPDNISYASAVLLRVGESERQTVEKQLSEFLSGYNLEHHHGGRFFPRENRSVRNLHYGNSAHIISVVYMRPRLTWHNITPFVSPNIAYGNGHLDTLLENIPHGDNGGFPWLIASYRADTWEIHALYGFSDGEHRLEKIVTWPQLF